MASERAAVRGGRGTATHLSRALRGDGLSPNPAPAPAPSALAPAPAGFADETFLSYKLNVVFKTFARSQPGVVNYDQVRASGPRARARARPPDRPRRNGG